MGEISKAGQGREQGESAFLSGTEEAEGRAGIGKESTAWNQNNSSVAERGVSTFCCNSFWPLWVSYTVAINL